MTEREAQEAAISAFGPVRTLGGGILLACYLLARLYWRRGDAVLPTRPFRMLWSRP